MSKTLKYFIIALIALAVILIAFVIYRIFFQFNQKLIREYAMEAAERYSDKSTAYKLIIDSAEDILSSHNRTQIILTEAKANRSGKEQELIKAALNQLYNFGILENPAKTKMAA